jgi:hypothetical protein
MRFAEKLKEMLANGVKNFVPQVSAELSRLGTQGSMEFASALYHGHGFVPYGPGQYTPTPEIGSSQQNEPVMEQEIQQEHGRHM